MFGFRKKNTKKETPKLGCEYLESREVPTVVAAPDFYTVSAGQTLTVPFNKGLLVNDFSSTNPAAILVTDLLFGPVSSGPPSPALPANSLKLNANGSFTFTAPSNFNSVNSPVTFTYQLRDSTNGDIDTATVSINVVGKASPLFAVGSGPGQTATVKVFDAASGIQRYEITPYESTFTGGVRVSTGDITQDGVDDIITVPGSGGSALVRVFDGKTGAQISQFFAFDQDFRGGAYVTIGDFDGDLIKDAAIGAGESGGPRVQVFSFNQFGTPLFNFANPLVISNFFAYESTFRNGVRVAAGDLDGDEVDELVTGAGPGGGPAVKVYGASELFSGFLGEVTPQKAFFAFDPNNRGGVNVAVGQFRGDGKADIVAGSGNGTATIRVIDGRSTAFLRDLNVPSSDVGSSGGLSGSSSGNLVGVGAPNGLSPFGTGGFGGAIATGGARISVTDRNGDGRSDIIVGQGLGSQPRVKIFDGNTFVEMTSFLAFGSNFGGGVWVGGNSLNVG